MNLKAVPSLTKRVLRASARHILGLGTPFRSYRELQLYVYDEPSEHWPGIGRELYETEPVFRASIQACCQHFLLFTGEDILPAFEGNGSHHLFEHHVACTILAIQIALTDLWTSKDILPDATLGLSMGEIAAVYAAGGLSQLDAIRVFSALTLASSLEDNVYLSLVAGCSLQSAQTLCRNAPVSLWAVYETSETTTILLCRRDDKEQATAYLNAERINWQQPITEPSRPFHTPLFRSHYQLIRNQLSQIVPQPLQRNFYSSAAGKLIPKHTVIDPMFWYELVCSPVLLNSTLTAAMTDRYQVMTHIGPGSISGGWSIRYDARVPDKIRVLDSMRGDVAELEQFEATYLQLKWLNRRRTYSLSKLVVARSKKTESLLPTLNLLAPASVEQAPALLAYLRRTNSICYLPQHKAWLVLQHDDVSSVLQQPDLFTYSPYQGADSLLPGADQPAHATIRALLQPLFSEQAMTSLREFVIDELNHRLDALVVRSSFDFVGELAIPLVQSVMGHLLGLRPIESESLQASLTGHLYEMGFLQNLERFFQCYLKDVPLAGDQLGSRLMREVKAGVFSSITAGNLMRLLWVAGTSTTSMILSSLVNTLVRLPHLANQLRGDHTLIPNFVDEGIRLAPPDPIRWRTVTRETTLAGQRLLPGTQIILSLLAANRDPQVFSDPDEHILHRSATHNLAFRDSIPQSIGAVVARLEAQVVVQVLLDRLPNLQLVAAPPHYDASTNLRGLATLFISPS